MAVANQATHFKIFTILSPVGDFCDIIILILINNFTISTANIHFFLIYANLLYFFGILLDFYWSYTGIIRHFVGWVAWVPAWLVRVGFACWKRSSRNPSLAGGFCGWSFWLWLFGSDSVLAEVKAKSPTQEGRFADEVFFFGSLCWLVCWQRSKKKAHPLRVGQPNLPKLLKFLLH